jgi:predicted nucleotidyltransferase
MLIYHSFDEIFRSWSHVAVLRALLDSTSGCTGNEVARISGMQPRSALKALTALETMCIVRRQRGGRDHLFTLNRDHVLVREVILPMLERERDLFSIITKELAANLKRSAMSAVVFGSVARREEIPTSDFDICCLIETEKQKDSLREKLLTLIPQFHNRFGIKISPLLFTIEELKKKKNNPLIKEIMDHGIRIHGKKMQELIHD